METIDILRQVWFLLIGVLFVGYSVLDGFDLGVGSLTPFLAKNDKEKSALLNSISPFWDGNEVWLLTAGGALFAAFPQAYATVFSGFYLALMLVLFSLIFRAVSIEFFRYDEERRWLWGWAFCIGSFLPSLLFGVALGNVIVGIPLNERLDFTGNFFTLLRPYPLVIGIMGLFMILFQGANFAALKTKGDINERALKTIPVLRICVGVALLLGFLVSIPYHPQAIIKPLSWIFCILTIFALFMNRMFLKNGKEWMAFIASSVAFCSLWGIVGAIHFPNLVKGIPVEGGVFDITIYNASSSLLTLKVMTIIALVGMPVVIGYSIFVYRIFKEKVSPEDKSYY